MKTNDEARQYVISPAFCYSPSAHVQRDYKTARSSIHTTPTAIDRGRFCTNLAGCSLLKELIYFFPVARIFQATDWVTDSKILARRQARNAKLKNGPIIFPISLPDHPSVCPHVTTWKPLGVFSLSLILGSFSDIPTLVKNGQNQRCCSWTPIRVIWEQLRR